MLFLNLSVLAGVALVVWWLTGIDKTHSGESKRDQYFFRTIRSVLVLFLMTAFLWFAEGGGGPGGGVALLLILPVSIALLLRSSLSELFTQGFIRFIDPTLHDGREFDPKQSRRYQDVLAHLIHNGHRDEAIKLCEELKQSGELDLVTLENTLEFLGVKQERPSSKPLAEIGRLRQEGRFAEAEQKLKAMLDQNPNQPEAAMMLVRLYAQDLRQPAPAHAILDALEKQPHHSASHIEFARRSINEWSQPRPVPVPTDPPPAAESIEELMAQRHFGSAIELLEKQIKAQPQDFALQLKLAEVYAVNCYNLPRAEKIIHQMEACANFTPQQIESARSKLKEWRAAAAAPRRAT
jgi:tetratricopeptide (TPR) repeat protein